jgi:hypothetical protein
MPKKSNKKKRQTHIKANRETSKLSSSLQTKTTKCLYLTSFRGSCRRLGGKIIKRWSSKMYRSKWRRMRGISPSPQRTTKWSSLWYTALGVTYSISPIVQCTELKKPKICFDFKFNYNEVFFK